MFRKVNKISGNIVDLINSKIFPGTLKISGGKITEIIPNNQKYDYFIIPGLVDAHIHIESSMLVPSEFARLAVIHGTVAVVSDPHEMANVLGIEGIRYMIDNGKKVPFKFYFGVPSCVPATDFETSGARITAEETEILFHKDKLNNLSEMMNFPGVLADDPGILSKITIAQKYGKPIDGHAPGLKGEELLKYIEAGISTDHEAYQFEEGLEKVKAGMKILIREGTAAKNFTELIGLINEYSDLCMFCCDDKHPNELVKSHINGIMKQAFNMGYDKFKVLKCASVNPVKHYNLDVGLLQKGDPADFLIIDSFEEFNILKTYIDGRLVAENGRSLEPQSKAGIINNLKIKPKQASDFTVKALPGRIKVIEALDGELVTNKITVEPKVVVGNIVSNPEIDILKIAVVNRYVDTPPAVAFIKNFGLKTGAIASSVAHDSHNIIAVGVNDQDIANVVNLIIKARGGLAAVAGDKSELLPLPVAGLMSVEGGFRVAQEYEQLAKFAKEQLGSTLKDPFMTMSFMSLLVIPAIKISDKGLFDVERFQFIDLFEKE